MGKNRKSKKSKSKKKVKEVAKATIDFESIFEKLTYYGFLLLAFFIPLLLSRNSYDQFDLPKMVFFRVITCFLVFFYLSHILLKPKSKIYWHPAILLGLIFLISVGISTILSVHIPTAIFGKYRRYDGFLMFLN